MARITEEQKVQMNVLYKRLGTYAAVAREIGCAPSTVKKYIIEDFVSPEEVKQKIFVPAVLPEIDFTLFEGKTFGEVCELSSEEAEEVKELWKEMLV